MTRAAQGRIPGQAPSSVGYDGGRTAGGGMGKVHGRRMDAVRTGIALAREGDAGDGALLMGSGIPEDSIVALRERDAADPRRVALRTASAEASRRARRVPVSLAPAGARDADG